MVTRPEGSAFDISTTISTKNYRLVTDWTFVSATSASRFIGSNAPEYSDKDVVREKVERWESLNITAMVMDIDGFASERYLLMSVHIFHYDVTGQGNNMKLVNIASRHRAMCLGNGYGTLLTRTVYPRTSCIWTGS